MYKYISSQTNFSNFLQENVGKIDPFLPSDLEDGVPPWPSFAYFYTSLRLQFGLFVIKFEFCNSLKKIIESRYICIIPIIDINVILFEIFNDLKKFLILILLSRLPGKLSKIINIDFLLSPIVKTRFLFHGGKSMVWQSVPSFFLLSFSSQCDDLFIQSCKMSQIWQIFISV